MDNLSASSSVGNSKFDHRDYRVQLTATILEHHMSSKNKTSDYQEKKKTPLTFRHQDQHLHLQQHQSQKL